MAEGNYEPASEKANHKNITTEIDISRRNTDVYFSSDDWLYSLLSPYVHKANKEAGWNYDTDWFESIQVARYSKGHHYAWHRDGGSDVNSVYNSENNSHKSLHGKVRKLSLCAILSDKYTGGELQISVPNPEGSNIISPKMKKGSVIVFPSFYYHRVTAVIEGIRLSLSMWCLGAPFK